MIMYFAKGFLFLLPQTLLLFLLQFGFSQDTITISKPIRDGDVLVSKGETFALGFFSPGVSTNRYVGIRYYRAPEQPVVWVANRDNPINDTSGVLSIDVHGNLLLHVEDRNQPIWSTNIVTQSSNNNTHAQLMDSGNLILVLNKTSELLWQSFDYPADTTLPNMKLGLDRTTGLNRILTSWKSKDDPGTGNCSYLLNTNSSSPELFLYKGSILWWRSGHWNGFGWSGTETTTSWVELLPEIFSRLVVDESGSIQRFLSREGDHGWFSLGSAPLDRCDNYRKCGAFGKCQLQNDTEFECTCLPGFQPKSPSEWSSRNASSGCVRKRGQASICKSGDGFVKVENVKLPDSSFARVDEKLSLKDYEQQCLENCSCAAYGGVDAKEEVGCLRWYGELIDTRVLNGGQNLYEQSLPQNSKGETFALGFFSPGVSTNRYVGIRYYRAPEQPVVWVANRDNPINDTSGVLSIDVHGNLLLHVEDRNQPIWSTNIVTQSSNNNTHAQLMDSGNLILVLNKTSEVLWQSFDYPADTTLPNMKLGLDRTTGLNRILTSWKSKDDPGTGNCSYLLNTNSSSPELFLYKGSILWWRSGHWNGFGWSGMNRGLFNAFLSREGDHGWFSLGSAPLDRCDNHGKCGAFGKCQLQNDTEFECTCLPGFQPKSPSEWSLRNASSGCVRKRGQASICKSGDGFVKVENVKLPDSSFARVDEKLSLKDCEQQCLENCSCAAYGGVDAKEEVGCLRWYGELIDTRVLNGGQNLYVRVGALELGT
nr:g-type lectin s-receptor-like serine/threonine-protein kinase [Quercus suber]